MGKSLQSVAAVCYMPRDREYEIVIATSDHVRAIAGRLRPGDAAEVEAAAWSQQRALWQSKRSATIAKTMLVGNGVAAIWGMHGSPLIGVGRPWLLTSPLVERVKIGFVREVKAEMRSFLSICPELHGMVDARYHQAVRLLEHLGFELSDPEPWGPHGIPFRDYVMRAA